MTKGIAFVERGIELYQQKVKEQQLRLLQKKATTERLKASPYRRKTLPIAMLIR